MIKHHIEELLKLLKELETPDLKPRDREKLIEAGAELKRFEKKIEKVEESKCSRVV